MYVVMFEENMGITDTVSIIFCSLIIFVPIVVGGIYFTKARIRYVSFTNQLRKNGKYTEWSSKNRIVLHAESFSIYAFLASFFGFIIMGILKFEDVARFFFICFIVFCLTGVISSFILYRKVPND